jgi:hypothetical protein
MTGEEGNQLLTQSCSGAGTPTTAAAFSEAARSEMTVPTDSVSVRKRTISTCEQAGLSCRILNFSLNRQRTPVIRLTVEEKHSQR